MTDPVVEQVRDLLLERSQRGIAKYGTTLEDNPLLLVEWLRHLQEELLDGANYCQAAINRLEGVKFENGLPPVPEGYERVFLDNKGSWAIVSKRNEPIYEWRMDEVKDGK